jgi:DNA-binding IclR family transcriptional regulator
MNDKSTDTVRATETTLDVLETIRNMDDGASVSQLAQRLPVAKSTVHKHVKTLERRGYVTRHEDEYRIGLRFLELGGIARRYDSVYEIAKPEIQRLADETGELANLMVEEYGWGIYVYTARGEQAVNLDTHLGKRIHLHPTALGKALLASLSDERIGEIIDQQGLPEHTDHTITGRETLREELATIRDDDVAYEQEERVNGMCCVSAPLTAHRERAAAISITGPLSRMSPERMHGEIRELVQGAANVIEVNLSYS